MEDLSCIGKATERQEAPDKVTGRACFAGDVYLPGMLHGAILRSPFPHARIVKIDTTAALACPGVRAVLTSADLPRRKLGEVLKDQPVLAEDQVRFVGERVAVVAASDEATARHAADLVRVDYEPLPAIFEIEEAMRPDSYPVHEDVLTYLKPTDQVKGNIYGYDRCATGNVEEGWKESDYIFEDTFSTQSVHQGYLENHVVMASAEPDGRATIWSSSKNPFLLRQQLAEYIGIPENRLRVFNLPVGGDFGGKGGLMDEPLCYFLSLATGRPVRIAMRECEELAAVTPRHPSTITIKSGLKKNGELVTRQVKIIFNSGAYGNAKPSPVLKGFNKTAGPYRIPHLLIEGYSVYTNNEPRGQCRAPGHPQAVFAVESHMDMLAKRMKMDPLAFRLLNVLKDGETAATGEKWRDLRAREVLETAARVGGWQNTRAEGMGLGISLAYRGTGPGESGAVVTVSNDGSVEVLTGAVESGTGSWTVLRQIAAEELGVDPETVRIVAGDTAAAPFDRGSAASRATNAAGWAVHHAAREAASVLKNAAANMLECRADEVMIGAGSFWNVSCPEKRLTMREVAARAGKQGPVMGHASCESGAKDMMSFVAHLAEVRVDRDTGRLDVTRLVAVQDSGRVLNPPAAEGQVEGAVVQGVGFALWEELAKQDGRLSSASLADYHVPTTLDIPEMEVLFIEDAPGPAPYGSKGIGELPIITVAAALANALEDATGVRITDLPLAPERVWQAIHNKNKKGLGVRG